MIKNKISLLILGSGTTNISPIKGSPGYFLKINKKGILIDSGNGTLYRLAISGCSIFDIDIIIYSHLHPDHVSDLLPLLHAFKWDPCRPKGLKEVKLLGPKSIIDYYSVLNDFFGKSISSEKNIFKIEEHVMENDKKTIDDISFITKRVPHSKDSIAYRIEYEGVSLVYSGDTDFNDSLVSLSKNCNILIIECSLPSNKKSTGHLTPSKIEQIVKRANPRKVLLTHIYPDWSTHEKKELEKLTKSNLYITGQDYMQINILENSEIEIIEKSLI